MVKKQEKVIKSNRPIYKILYVFILIYLGLFFFQKINFEIADLGRFIQNGAIFFNEGKLIQTNLYSYTEPEYKFGNHHWGVGVIYFLIHKISGFKGLSAFNLIIIIGAIFLFIKSSFKTIKHYYIALAVLICAPLFNWRIEVRPETISYLFLGIYYFNLNQFINSKQSIKRTAVVILPLMLLWVNTHIFFVVGLALLSAFLFCSLFLKKYKGHSKKLGFLMAGAILIALLNPGGIWGLLEPFMIFKEYGHGVSENMSVIYMQRIFNQDVKFWYLEAFVLLMVVGIGFFIYRKRKGEEVDEGYILKSFLFICFLFPAFAMIRFIPLLGLISIPIVAHTIQLWEKIEVPFYKKEAFYKKTLYITVLLLVLGFVMPANDYTRYWAPFYNKEKMGLGLKDKVEVSAELFKELNIKGPILNNYDIGGYLIYYLFPKNRVFVDNRPEAYSVGFFNKEYNPLHESEEAWQKINKKYNFNVIYYYRLDLGEHVQPFLLRRVRDPEWAPIFFDDWTIILLKRNDVNKSIIDEYELPQSMFSETVVTR